MAIAEISFQEDNLSMEELLKQSEVNMADIHQGSIITGEIVGFHPEKNPTAAIVAMGTKSEGKISLNEFHDSPKVGDEVEALVKSLDKDTGLILLSKNELERRKGWEVVNEAFEKNVPVAGIVEKKLKQGYSVNVEGLPMFLPHSHVGILQGNRNDRPDFVGSEVIFRIIEINSRKKTGILSRRQFQEEQNGQLWQELTKKIHVGDTVEGVVKKHVKTGAFIEIEGIDGFLHHSNMSWERHNDNYKENIPVDTKVKTKVLEIDPENLRLSLGLKQLTSDPWESVTEQFSIGDIVKGRVSFVANYGAFVEIGKAIEGLLHVSEMSWTKKVNHAREIVKLDDSIEAKIIGINLESKRISLGLKQLQTNPWDYVRDNIKVGDVLKGKIKKVTTFGAFVQVTDDIDGLIRKEDLNWEEPAPEPKNLYKKNDEVEYKVVEINLEDRKIGCSIRHLLPNPYRDLKRKYSRGTVLEGKITGITDFGIFVKIDDNLEGLVHLSSMTKDEATSIKKTFQKGNKVKVVLRSVDPEKRKISLSTRDIENALEKMEISQYIEKEGYAETLTSSPFENLKSLVSDKKK
ncbi:MAG: 30S ribosomal protein S1 [Spirochaetia bacterium]|nr:30S ribosomal protein S1 [Spirochaetia bacterium]